MRLGAVRMGKVMRAGSRCILDWSWMLVLHAIPTRGPTVSSNQKCPCVGFTCKPARHTVSIHHKGNQIHPHRRPQLLPHPPQLFLRRPLNPPTNSSYQNLCLALASVSSSYNHPHGIFCTPLSGFFAAILSNRLHVLAACSNESQFAPAQGEVYSVADAEPWPCFATRVINGRGGEVVAESAGGGEAGYAGAGR